MTDILYFPFHEETLSSSCISSNALQKHSLNIIWREKFYDESHTVESHKLRKSVGGRSHEAYRYYIILHKNSKFSKNCKYIYKKNRFLKLNFTTVYSLYKRFNQIQIE